MKKLTILLGVAVVGVVLARSGFSGLDGHTKALAEAKALSASLTYQQIGGVPIATKVDLAKPSMARIDRGNELIVADGKTITVLDKKANTYYTGPQNAAEFARYFSEDELSVFAPFFDASAFEKLGKLTDAGTKNRKGVSMNVVEGSLGNGGEKKATYYVDPTTNLIRQVEYVYDNKGTVVRMLLDTKDVTIKAEAKADLFAFKAPEGSKQLTEADLISDKWYYDLEEAKEVAKKTKRLLMVDFYADW